MGALNAGQLDRRIGLYHQVATENAQNGEEILTYPTAYATVFSKKADLRGTKRLVAQQTTSQQQTEFTIRFRTDILSSDRVIDVETGLAYEILQMAQLGRHDGLNLLCRAVIP